MKKILFFLFAFLCSVSHASAEKHFSSNVAIGGKGGVTFSRMAFSPSVPQTMLMGTMIGATFRYAEEKNFGFIVELNAEQRGWKETFKQTSYTFQRRLTYIQLPLLTHIYFGNTKFQGFFNAGPELGYMIGEKTTSNFDVNNFASLSDFPSTNRNTAQFTMGINSKIDYGISVGAGMEYIAKHHNSFVLEGRFYYGLGNVFSSHKKDVFSASTGMSVMVTLGYMYRIK